MDAGSGGGGGGSEGRVATYICPITLEIVTKHPVCTEVGTIYSRDTLKEWETKGGDDHDPVTREPLLYYRFKRVWKVDNTLFQRAVQAGTVNTTFRAALRKRIAASGYLRSIAEASSSMLTSVIRDCLRRASHCATGAKMLDGPLQAAAAFLLENNVAIPNKWLLDWLATEDGRRLTAKLTDRDRFKYKVEGVFIMMLFRPNDERFVSWASAGVCYYGHMADSLSKPELRDLIQTNRKWLKALAEGDIRSCGY